MEEMIQNFILMLAQKQPWVLAVLAFMGTLRAINKPLFAFARALVASTKSKKDDEFLDKVEQSKAKKYLDFVLDWLFSIKISPVEPKPVEPPK